MNMMLNEEFAKAEQANASETDASKNPALARMMKAWESKQAKNARKATGLGLVAVSLAACGGSSSSDDGDDDDDGDIDVGQVFTLTTGVDTPANLEAIGPSTIAGNVFNAPLGVGIDGLVGVQTLQEADVLVGTDEIDILNATLNGTGAGGAFAAPSITGIEILNLTATSSLLGNDAGLSLANASGYTQIWNINSGEDLTVVGVRDAAAIGLDGVSGGTTYSLNFTSSADTTELSAIANAVGTSVSSGQANLSINAVNGVETLNLSVENTVRLNLQDDAAGIEVFNITGSGITQLSADGNFPNLVTLNSAGNSYTGDLTLDVSGSTSLEEVTTGEGDDRITVNRLAMDGEFNGDMGDGDDTLVVTNPTFIPLLGIGTSFVGSQVSALDFGSVVNVETLEFAQGFTFAAGVSGVLDLSGFNEDLATVNIPFVNTNGNNLTINGASEEMAIDVTTNLLMGSGALSVEGSIDLMINAGTDIQLSSMNSATVESLVLNAGDDVFVTSGTMNSLVSLEVNALGTNTDAGGVVAAGSNAFVTLDDNGLKLDALETVTVAAEDTADLTMTGRESEIVGLQDDLVIAQGELADDQAAVLAAQTAVDNAQADVDQALIDQGIEQAGVTAAEGVVTAAQADADAAEAVLVDAQEDVADAQTALTDAEAVEAAAQTALDDAQDDVTAAQTAVDDAEAALTAAQTAATVLIQAFEAPNTGLLPAARDANEVALKNYINSTALPPALKADLIANLDDDNVNPEPGGNLANGFTEANIELWLDVTAADIIETYFANDSAEADALAAAEVVLDDAEAAEATALSALGAASAAVTAAGIVLADAQTAEAAAQLVFNDAVAALDAAELALAEAESDLADAIEAVVTAQSNLAGEQANLSQAQADVVAAQQVVTDLEAAIAAAGTDGVGFESLETVMVTGNDAVADLTDVYGEFALEVVGNENAEVSLVNTNATSVSVSVGENVVYEVDADDNVIGYEEGDAAFIFVGAGASEYGNPNLVSLDVSGAGAFVTLEGDLSSMTTIDLTGVTIQFDVDASGADFAPAAGDYVTYLIGGTSSDWAEGYSFIDAADARETFKFTEADFGTIVIDGFNAGADPVISDRLDLSDLGFDGNIATLVREQGTFDETDGSFSVGAGDDVRITDLAGGSLQFSGEIILMNVDADDLVGNIL